MTAREPAGGHPVTPFPQSTVTSIAHCGAYLDVHLRCGHSVTRLPESQVVPGQVVECVACDVRWQREQAGGDPA